MGPLNPRNDGVNEQVIDRHGRRDGDLEMVWRRSVAGTEARESHAQRADLVARMRIFAIRMNHGRRLRNQENGDQRGNAEHSGSSAAHGLDPT